ncbi:MAG: cytochrome c oxidase assembly factor Coa1 family protein [Vicingaceae bacterium]|nr:cytochrome c oxidase assembly factor Coa1 family protein [Vicingaceae bacterium]
MTNPTTHKKLVTTGCLMWCASFFGEAFLGQPYSTVGIIISPILTIIGVFYWFKYYRATRGRYPKFQTIWQNTTKNGGMLTLNFDFLIKHILEFWTFCILFWMGLVLIMILTFRRSDAFEATKNYCQTNQEIISQTGEIKYYGIFVSGNMSNSSKGGKAEFSFTIVGSKGNFSANSKLNKESGVWTIENLNLR